MIFPHRTTICMFVASCTLVATLGSAQEKKITKKDVPVAVVAAFEKAYPKATIKGFAKEVEKGKTYYEIESVDGGMTRDLLYLADGTVAETEEGVAESDLPASVKEAVSKKYPDGKIVKAEKTTHGTAVQYDIRIASGGTKVGMSVDPSGKVIEEKKPSPKKTEAGQKK